MFTRGEESRLRKAAKAGDLDAATSLADILEEQGYRAQAEYWNRKAANAGDLYGMLSLAVSLLDRGVIEEGERWARKAASSNEANFATFVPIVSAALGRSLLIRNNLDEAEQWLTKGAEGGDDDAIQDLERLRQLRSKTGQSESSSTTGDQTLQTFEVSSVMFYDGSGHRLGPSTCTLTKSHFIIDDARGGISQILLRDINGVSTPGRFVSPKQLRITAPGVAYDIYCASKDQKNLLEAWLSKAIRGG